MGLTDIQTKVAALAQESQTIAAKADLSDADMTRIQEISVEGGRLQIQMDALKKLGDFQSWAGQSAGILSFTGGQSGGATVHGMRAAGVAEIETRASSILVNSEGEGLLDDRTMRVLRNPDYSREFKTYLRKGLHGMKSDGLKVLSEGSDPAGGYLVPEDILARLLAKEPTPTRVAGNVQTFNTSRDSVVIPKVNYTTDDLYTTGMRVTWTGEVPASATTHRVTEPVFGQKRIPIYTAMMSLPLTNDLIEDSAFDLVGWCTSKFSETNDLLRDNMAINGTGIGQPHGILVNPNGTDNPATVASTAAAALTWEGLQNLIWALPEQYDQNAKLVFNKTNVGLAISKLVDGDGRPLWKQGVGDSGMVGSPMLRQLLGYPVLYDGFMPNVGAGNYPIIFGDLRGYVIVNRVGFSMQVLRELYAETNQILLLGRVRFGGLTLEEWRLKIQVVSA